MCVAPILRVPIMQVSFDQHLLKTLIERLQRTLKASGTNLTSERNNTIICLCTECLILLYLSARTQECKLIYLLLDNIGKSIIISKVYRE